MKIAHIIMAHKNPVQLERLIKKLTHQDADIYVHIDAKFKTKEFIYLEDISNVFFIVNRTICNWGGFSLLRGILNCLVEILQTGNKYDYINLISGQDYPLHSAQHCHNYFEQNHGSIFISYEESSESDWWKSALLRYEKYHLTDYTFKGRYIVEKIINKVLPKRKFPNHMKLFGGNKSCWWTLTTESAEYIVSKLINDHKLINFLKFCWGTDEFVIPTLLMNSKLKNKVVNNNLRYIDWSEGNAHPKILSVDSEIELLKSDMLYARKFDIYVDNKILDKIDSKN